jgi:hypothetical protein
MPTCPNGHDSTDEEFCDVCGLAMNARPAAPPATPTPAPSTPLPTLCPACDTPLDGRFCEACGHDSLAAPPPRATPAPAAPPAAEPSTPPPPSEPRAPSWTATVVADRAYYNTVMSAGGPDADSITFPSFCPERYFPLRAKEITIGRRSTSRGTHPDIDLTGPPEDPGVSHLHAVLRLDPDGTLTVEDIGSSNGTTLNDNKTLPPHTRHPLTDGDRIHLGAWTTITVQQDGP